MADILFVTSTKDHVLNQEVNGTMLLVTKLLQAGFDAEILRFGQIEGYHQDYTTFINRITAHIVSLHPKCVSFYTLWSYYHVMLRVAREVKKCDPDIIIVLGGPQASTTAAPTMAAMDYVDYICTGEGENTVVPFFHTLLNEHGANLASIPGLYYRDNGTFTFNDTPVPLCDMNTLPQWDDRLLAEFDRHPEPNWGSNTYFMNLDVGRGCPFNCTFCASSHFWCRKYRMKSPERIVEDMLFYYRRFGIRSFAFSHDAYTVNMKLVEQVCDHIIATGLDIRWTCASRLNCISEDLLLKMKQAGLMEIKLGVETGSKRMQKLTKKNLQLDQLDDMVTFMLKNGIRVGLYFMYGFPEETEEDLSDTLDLLFSMLDKGVDDISMSFCSFNPKTEMTEKYLDQLVLDPEIEMLTWGSYGYQEELETIKNNKALFPFFYNLDTPLRKRYQYLSFFVSVYRKFPKSVRLLRRLYNGDNLKFYRDFYNNNPECFTGTIAQISNYTKAKPLDLLLNTAKDFDLPYINQLKAVLKYDYIRQQISLSKKNITMTETFDFNYNDYKQGRPIEEYSKGKTEILLQNIGGTVYQHVLQISTP